MLRIQNSPPPPLKKLQRKIKLKMKKKLNPKSKKCQKPKKPN